MNKYLVFLLSLLLFGGCGGQNPAETDPPSQAVIDYVAGFDLPQLQGITTMLEVPEEEVGVYFFEYGATQDCQAGCFYDSGTILRHGDKFGWLDGAMLGDDPASSGYGYDFAADEAYLFTDDFSRKIAEAFGYPDYAPLIWLLARDPDTPKSVLRDYASWLSVQRGLGYLAGCLLSNPVVQVDPDILSVLAGMDEADSEYTEYILAARTFLAAI